MKVTASKLREDVYRQIGDLGDPAAIPAIEHRARLEAEGRQQRNAERAVQKILASQSKEKFRAKRIPPQE